MSSLALTVAVLGTGTMGQGIAQVMAMRGHATRMYDSSGERAQAAMKGIVTQLTKMVDKGKLTADARGKAMSYLSVGVDAKEVARGADVVIEAVPEDMDLKVRLFSEIALVASSKAILATNTSSLSISELGKRIGVPERTIGLHFFNPPPVMELVEIVRGNDTSEDTVERALAFVKSLPKTPILVRDMPGFATSRLGVILGAEAMRMLESGVASAEDIDRGMELGYRHPMGPLKLTDLVGLDVRLAILEYLTREIGEQFRPPAILKELVSKGKLGKKSGEGFYLWNEGVATPKAR